MSEYSCPKCNSSDTVSRGKSIACKSCGKWSAKTGLPSGSDSVEYSHNFISIVCSSPRVISEEDIISKFKIDTTRWELESFQVKTSEGYRKDRQVEWDVDDGLVKHGRVRDTGKMLIVPMYHVRARFSKKVAEIKDRESIRSFMSTAEKFTPRYTKIKYPKIDDGHLLELGLPDMQLGRLVMESEAGKASSPEILIKQADGVVDNLLLYSKGFPVERVLFPIGNDYFNSNTAEMKTAHGTPQQDDVRWQKTFKLGCEFIVRTVDKLSTLAPVDVLVIPGNHDEERVFYLGEYLSAWYRTSPNVKVDNQEKKRKYYQYKKNLIGLTHGYWEKNDRLAALMPHEEPIKWADTINREWHLGDKHHKVDMIYKTNEMENGVVIRILRSIASPSVWEYDKGLVGSLKAGEVFIWHPEKGVIAQFTGAI